jgi:hypothetical protein
MLADTGIGSVDADAARTSNRPFDPGSSMPIVEGYTGPAIEISRGLGKHDEQIGRNFFNQGLALTFGSQDRERSTTIKWSHILSK